jgi:hypothetical protein
MSLNEIDLANLLLDAVAEARARANKGKKHDHEEVVIP